MPVIATQKKKTVIHRLDKLFSKIIRSVDYCQLKGLDNIRCSGNLQCMHITTRGNKNLRWDFNNAICGCAGHHIYYTYRVFDWVELVREYFPEKYSYVNLNRSKIKKWTTQELLDLEQDFIKKLNENNIYQIEVA